MTEENASEENTETTEEHPHVCSSCGKPSATVICHACEDKIRGEAAEKNKDVNKAGK